MIIWIKVFREIIRIIKEIGELIEKGEKMKFRFKPVEMFFGVVLTAIGLIGILSMVNVDLNMDGVNEEFYNMEIPIIDNIQLLFEKERSRKEFFRRFNELYKLDRHNIVLPYNKFSKETHDDGERLVLEKIRLSPNPS